MKSKFFSNHIGYCPLFKGPKSKIDTTIFGSVRKPLKSAARSM